MNCWYCYTFNDAEVSEIQIIIEWINGEEKLVWPFPYAIISKVSAIDNLWKDIVRKGEIVDEQLFFIFFSKN